MENNKEKIFVLHSLVEKYKKHYTFYTASVELGRFSCTILCNGRGESKTTFHVNNNIIVFVFACILVNIIYYMMQGFEPWSLTLKLNNNSELLASTNQSETFHTN